IAAFALRRSNREIAETLVDAFVTGIHAGDPTVLSVKAAFPRLTGFEAQFGSITRGMAHAARQRRLEARAAGQPPPQAGRMWSFREGLGVLVETLRERLQPTPLTSVIVRRIEKTAGGSAWMVVGEGRERWPADEVVLTCPAHQQAGMVADLDPLLAEQMAG